jgi:hypothetical protein
MVTSTELGVYSGMTSYNYCPLVSNRFRILEILQAEPSVQSRLVEDDSTEREYVALSYAWGADRNTATMECDGQLLNLTSHLLEGLKSIYAHTGAFSIWVDAICINQNDDAEKATQVAKMHKIYCQARCVFVWLGKEQDSSDVAMDAIMAASLVNVPGLPENTDEALIALVQHKSNTPTLFKESAFGSVARLSDRACSADFGLHKSISMPEMWYSIADERFWTGVHSLEF